MKKPIEPFVLALLDNKGLRNSERLMYDITFILFLFLKQYCPSKIKFKH